MAGRGFAFPRTFKGESEIRPSLEANNRYLTTHMNTYVPSYDSAFFLLIQEGLGTIDGTWSPSQPTHFTTKAYVDAQIGGASTGPTAYGFAESGTSVSITTTETTLHTHTVSGLTASTSYVVDMLVTIRVTGMALGAYATVRAQAEATGPATGQSNGISGSGSAFISISGTTSSETNHSHSGTTDAAGGASNVSSTTTGITSGHDHSVPFGHQHPSNAHTYTTGVSGAHSHTFSGSDSDTVSPSAPTYLQVVQRWCGAVTSDGSGQIALKVLGNVSTGSDTCYATIAYMIY